MSYRSTWDGRSGYSGKRHTLRNLLLVLLALGYPLLWCSGGAYLLRGQDPGNGGTRGDGGFWL